MEPYDIPFFQRSGLKKSTIANFVVCSFMFLGASILFFTIMVEDDFVTGLFGVMLIFPMAIISVFALIYAGILKKFFIEITSEYIRYYLLFKRKTVYWEEIYEVYMYSNKGSITIAFLLKKDIAKKSEKNISNNFNSSNGIPSSSFQIVLSFFKDIDYRRLFLTAQQQISKSNIKDEFNYELYRAVLKKKKLD